MFLNWKFSSCNILSQKQLFHFLLNFQGLFSIAKCLKWIHQFEFLWLVVIVTTNMVFPLLLWQSSLMVKILYSFYWQCWVNQLHQVSSQDNNSNLRWNITNGHFLTDRCSKGNIVWHPYLVCECIVSFSLTHCFICKTFCVSHCFLKSDFLLYCCKPRTHSSVLKILIPSNVIWKNISLMNLKIVITLFKFI